MLLSVTGSMSSAALRPGLLPVPLCWYCDRRGHRGALHGLLGLALFRFAAMSTGAYCVSVWYIFYSCLCIQTIPTLLVVIDKEA